MYFYDKMNSDRTGKVRCGNAHNRFLCIISGDGSFIILTLIIDKMAFPCDLTIIFSSTTFASVFLKTAIILIKFKALSRNNVSILMPEMAVNPCILWD